MAHPEKKSADNKEGGASPKGTPTTLVMEPENSPFSTGFLPASLPPIEKTDGKGLMGQVIRLYRREKGLSQEELAHRARIDRTTIARLECGIFKSLSVEKLEGIATAIGVDLKTLLHRAEAMNEAPSYRGHLGHVEFSLDYPDLGFRIVSQIPQRREFFFGKIEIHPQKSIASDKLPHPEQIYLHCLEGRMLFLKQSKEIVLKPGDCFVFSGSGEYEFYNPDQFKTSSSLFITYPSFLSL